MTDIEQRSAAKEFIANWAGKGYENGQSQPFWLSLLSCVFGAKNPEQMISFEDQVMMDHTGFIDGNIRQTHVLIEQKSISRDLRKPIKQSERLASHPISASQAIRSRTAVLAASALDCYMQFQVVFNI